MADSIIKRDQNLTDHWGYEYGLTLEGIFEVYKSTKDQKYLDFINKVMDTFIGSDGSIRGYSPDEYNIDHLNNGKMVLKLYELTHEERYLKAAKSLAKQAETHPRTQDKVFWHKMIYPHQIWCDGLYMGAAFLAAFERKVKEQQDFSDVALQFINSYPHLVDAKTGLLYHAYDESKSMYWADKQTGHSAHFWGRAMGWYVMALIDVIELMDESDPLRAKLADILDKCLSALLKVQDPKTHVWYQILDEADRSENYLEASASCMITAALFKAVRLKVFSKISVEELKATYQGLLDQFILETKDGLLNLNKICYVAGLGGKTYRDGSFAYYMSEPIISNEPKGLGPFLFAASEAEKMLAD
ncbi:MAG: glycoside hydrolase family 88 protein [Succinivibrio sp.]|nr:glycoside hydrolase family 88 protein [Succinivibrio sp.]